MRRRVHDFIFLGCGLRAATLLPHFFQHRKARVAALVDKNPDSARRLADWIASQTGSRPPQFEEAHAALEAFPDAGIFLLTPQYTHLALARQVRGRPIFLEKPLAHTPSECRALYRLLRDNPAPVQIGFVLRLAPFYRKIKSLLQSRTLGRVVQIQMHQHLSPEHAAQYRLNWRRRRELSGGLLNEKACHDLDLMFWLLEALPQRIYAAGNRGIFPHRKNTPAWCSECNLECGFRNSYHRFNRHVAVLPSLEEVSQLPKQDPRRIAMDGCVYHTDADICEQYTVSFEFPNGTLGAFSLVTLGDEDRREIRVYGEKGMLEGCLERGRLRRVDFESGREEEFRFAGEDPHGGGDAAIVEEFLRAAGEGGKVSCPLRAGTMASLAAFAAEEARESGRPVVADFSLDEE